MDATFYIAHVSFRFLKQFTMKGNLVKRSKQDQEQEKLDNFWQQGTLHVMNGHKWKTFTVSSRVAQWKRAGPITQRSEDQNLALLNVF